MGGTTSTSVSQVPLTFDSKFPALTPQEVKDYKDMEFEDDQIRKLNEKGEAKLKQKVQRYTIPDVKASCQQANELRLVLLGKTGAGKSATGNLIIGETVFTESATSLSYTKTNKCAEATVGDVRITLVDTPGLCDTTKDDKEILTEIAKIFNKFSSGIHGFLFVFGLGNPRFTEEEREAFHAINKAFQGEKFFEHCFMVLTHGDSLKESATLAGKLKEEEKTPFGKLIADMNNKAIIVDNHASTEYLRKELQRSLVALVANNVKEPFLNYTIDQYQEDKKKVKELLAEKDRPHAEIVELLVHSWMDDKRHSEIENMSSSVIKSQAKKFKNTLKEQRIEVNEDSIERIIKAQRERITDESFLDQIRQVWAKLLNIFRG